MKGGQISHFRYGSRTGVGHEDYGHHYFVGGKAQNKSYQYNSVEAEKGGEGVKEIGAEV